MKESKKIRVLAEDVLEKLKEVNYKKGTLRHYRRVYDDLIDYAVLKGKDLYSLKLSQAFLLEKYGIDTTEKIDNASLPSGKRIVKSKIRLLDDYYVHGVFIPQANSQKRCEVLMSDSARELLSGYVDYCEKSEQSSYGIKSRRGRILQFLRYLSTSGRDHPSKIDALAISDYVKTLLPRHEKSISADLVALRSFLRWLCREAKTETDLSLLVPRANRYNYPKIPSVWEKDNVASLLGAIDRTSPVGKRDYAALSLAARLGMRAVDIRFLALANLDFTNKTISFAQHKTKVAINYPMTEEIGWALADWLKNGRPTSCPHDYVFSLIHPPFGQTGCLNNRIIKYARKAGITLDGQQHYGMHSLRHTLASTLLEQGVSLSLITDVLGHMDPKSTSVYLHCDIEGLRACAIDPDEEANYA